MLDVPVCSVIFFKDAFASLNKQTKNLVGVGNVFVCYEVPTMLYVKM